MFELDSRLANDCALVTDLPLCRVLLMKDANYPWLILVPRIAGLKEIIELSTHQQSELYLESNRVSRCLQQLFSPDKLNIAALGNVVSQLHIHHIARFTSDAAWPKPVWGTVPATAYSEPALNERIALIKQGLETNYDYDHHQ